MRKRFSFSIEEKEKIEEKIFSAINKAEEGEKEHLLHKEEIIRVVEEIINTPFGFAEGVGGSGEDNYKYYPYTEQLRPNSEMFTYFNCSWYSWRNKKHILLIVYRTHTLGVSHLMIRPKGKRIKINTECKKIPYENLFPERYSTYVHLKNLRSVRHLPKPPSRLITQLKKEDGGIVLAKFKDIPFNTWVGTPAGWFRTKYESFNRSAWLHLKDLGFPVPARKNKRIWNEKMEAYAIMKNI